MIWHKISKNDQKNRYVRQKTFMNKDSMKKNLWHTRKKICSYSPNFRGGGNLYFAELNFKVKKSVYILIKLVWVTGQTPLFTRS